MSLTQEQIVQAAGQLVQAADSRKAIPALTDSLPGIRTEDAYQIQLYNVEQAVAKGAKVVGKKIGLTSPAMQTMLKVDEPDYGHLLDYMLIYQGEPVPMERLLQPRIEGEIAFVMARDLKGPGVTPLEVALATAGVTAALEIIDSRIADWKIKIQDTVADNASGAAFVLGSQLTPLAGLDLRHTGFVLAKNGHLAGTAAGAAVLGSPLQSVAWLVNKLGELGVSVQAGEIILSGAAPAAVPVAAGDSIHLVVDRLGEVSCRFE